MEALENLRPDKASKRRHFREARSAFVRNHGEAAADRLTLHLDRLLADLALPQVALYQPTSEEASFHLQGVYFYPRIGEGSRLHFWRPHAPENFLINALGISEPDPKHSTPLDLSQDFVVCCPAVALDWAGRRLGQGKGYYDRFFADHPRAVRVGVVYQIQMSKDPLPAESWDQPLDWIVTEEMILRTANRSR